MAARDPLARRDDERLQPARQHGRARGDPGRRSRSRSSRSTPSRSTRIDARARRSRSPARARVVGFLPFNLRPAPERARLHGRLAARRCSASRSPRSGCRRAGRSRRRPSRRSLLPDPRARRADPRHDARHDRAPARRPAGLAGRPRPQLAPARPLRRLREARRRAARADRGRARRHEPRLQRARRPAARARRRARHVRRCSCSSRASSPTSSGAPRRRTDAGLLQAFAVHWRRLVEVVVDFGLIVARVRRRVRDPLRLAGHRSTSGTSRR